MEEQEDQATLVSKQISEKHWGIDWFYLKYFLIAKSKCQTRIGSLYLSITFAIKMDNSEINFKCLEPLNFKIEKATMGFKMKFLIK